MTIPCSVLGAAMPFVGVDPHTIFGPPPVPAVAPDITVGTLMMDGPPAFSGNRVSGTVKTPAASAIGRGHDTGPFFFHIPTAGLDSLYGLVVAGGTSKCQWGVATVLIDDANGSGTKPIATGVLDLVNIQQQCGDFAPGLSGQVGASWLVSALNSTVKAGMTAGDYVGGLFAVLHDSFVTAAVSMVLGWGVGKALPGLGYYGQTLVNDLLQWYVIGTPGGYSAPWTLYNNEIIHDYLQFNDDSAFDYGHKVVNEGTPAPAKAASLVEELL